MTEPQSIETKSSAAALERFASVDASSRNGRSAERDVLLVAFSEEKQQELAAACAEAGWTARVCEGPPTVSCPLVTAGHPCQDRLSSDVAVVMIDPDHRLSSGQLPIAYCAGCGSSPGVIVVQRVMDEMEIEGRIAIVGGTSKAEVVVAAVKALLKEPAAETPSSA